VKAFEVSAVDYLLKPIEPDRLAAALSKVQAAALAAMSTTVPVSGPTSKQDGPLEQIFVRTAPPGSPVPRTHECLMINRARAPAKRQRRRQKPRACVTSHTATRPAQSLRHFFGHRESLVTASGEKPALRPVC